DCALRSNDRHSCPRRVGKMDRSGAASTPSGSLRPTARPRARSGLHWAAAAVAVFATGGAPAAAAQRAAAIQDGPNLAAAVAVERLRAADARAGAATSGAPSTRLSDQELEDAVAALQSRIRAAEENGPNSPELIEPLSALGALYQESGQHLLAASAIK